MNKLLLTILLLVSAWGCAFAQEGLNINRVFGGRYCDDKEVTETLITGSNKFLKKHKLEALASFRGPAATYSQLIGPLVLADGRGAKGRNVRYRDGQLYFAFFELKPLAGGARRYIYYVNNAADKGSSVVLIYFQGRLSPAQVSAIIQDMSKNNSR